MSQITYFNLGATVSNYSSATIDYVNDQSEGRFIADAANKLGRPLMGRDYVEWRITA